MLNAARENQGVARSAPLRSFLGVAAAVLVGSGCILFVHDDPDALGLTCHVQGEGTACGKCIIGKCQPRLDACCGDPACSPSLGALDACIQNFAGNCASYTRAPATAGTASAEDALSACIATDCAAICQATSGTSITDCFALGTGCECLTRGTFNDVTCASSTVDGGVCCAEYGWPNTGLDCNCTAGTTECPHQTMVSACSARSGSLFGGPPIVDAATTE